MDKGNILNHEFRIIPGQNGSFIVMQGVRDMDYGGLVPKGPWGFSTVADLLKWLTDEAAAWQMQSTGQNPNEKSP